jgi:hypothetical protein
MNLSSNELFHFTEFKYLKSILESKSFLPRFNLEFTHLSDSFQRRSAFLPIAMVCFCDIPFEHSKTHRKRYGNHGIVLTENWKLMKALNPIIYIQSESFLANIFANFVNMTNDFIPLMENKENEIKVPLTLANVGNNLTYLTYFLKQFENKTKKMIEYEGKIRVFEKRKFYDEREWRYIPFEADNKNELLISIQDYDNLNKLEQANKNLEKYKLDFELDDIKYLIVNNKKEKQELNNLINEIFKQKIDIKIVE